jgi:hypothetical protein
LFSPLARAVYGNTGPVRVSWAIEREAVASGEAEPIDDGSGDSEMSIVGARYLSWLWMSVCVVVCVAFEGERKVAKKGQRSAGGRRARAKARIFM